jgi:hypothetical protein
VDRGKRVHTLAKYLQMFSAELFKSWLKGQAFPAWQVPWRKNLHGTCEVSRRAFHVRPGTTKHEQPGV